MIAISQVLDHWKTRSLEKSQGDAWVEQIRLCVVIGRECIDPDPTKRPTIQRIIGRIDEMDLIYGLTETHASLERHVSFIYSKYLYRFLLPHESIAVVSSCRYPLCL